MAVRPSIVFGTAAALLGLILLLALSAPIGSAVEMELDDYEAGPYALGGEFALTNQFGKKASLSQYRGKAVLIFFGYTFCPDVCPTTLTEMGRMEKLLGAGAAQVQPIFITVDPARDTPGRLKAYLGNFAKGIVGMTGTDAEIREIATRYQVRYARSSTKTPSGYLMDHTGFVYLLDGTGKVRYLFPYDAGPDMFAAGVRAVLKG